MFHAALTERLFHGGIGVTLTYVWCATPGQVYEKVHKNWEQFVIPLLSGVTIFFYYFVKIDLFYMTGRGNERGRVTEMYFPSAVFTPEYLQWPHLGQAEVWSQGAPSGLPLEYQGPST